MQVEVPHSPHHTMHHVHHMDGDIDVEHADEDDMTEEWDSGEGRERWDTVDCEGGTVGIAMRRCEERWRTYRYFRGSAAQHLRSTLSAKSVSSFVIFDLSIGEITFSCCSKSQQIHMVQLDGPDSEIQLARLAEQRARRAQRSRRRYANMNADEKVRTNILIINREQKMFCGLNLITDVDLGRKCMRQEEEKED